MNEISKKIVWYVAGVLTLFIITLAFVPQVLDSKKQLKQGDITQFKGTAKEIQDYTAKDGKQPLWTNSMFSGMPSYIVSTKYEGNIFSQLNGAFRKMLPEPAPMIFMMMVSFFIMGACMGLKPSVSLIGSVAFAFSTYYIVVLSAGHNAKVNAVVYFPMMFGGLYHAYRHSAFKGAAVFGVALVLDLVTGHPQMTYYFFFLAAFFVVFEAIFAIKDKKIKHFAVASVLLGLTSLLAFGSYYNNYVSLNQYSKYSTRGKTELTRGKDAKTNGLDPEYITDWSYGIGETFSLLVPNYKGGESDAIGNNKAAIKSVDGQYRETVANQNAYWGNQPFTGGPTYAGALVVLLFLAGLVLVKDRVKYPLVLAAVFTLVLSWGENISFLTDLFIAYFPLYDKFRAVASMVVVPEFIIPLVACLLLAKLSDETDFQKPITLFGQQTKISAFKVFAGISGAIIFFLLIIFIAPGITGLIADKEFEQLAQYPDIQAQIETARASILRADALRSLFFVIVGAALVGFYMYKPFNKYILLVGVFVLVTADMFLVNTRYINSKNFSKKKSKTEEFVATTSDQMIMSDPGNNNRVLNLTVSPFNDGSTSYFHKSIGGYHGAKMKKYQEMIQYGLNPEIEQIIGVLQKNPSQRSLDSVLSSANALNLMNTKYVILNEGGSVVQNKSALGNAWFVNNVQTVDNADQELDMSLSMNPKTTAVTQKSFAEAVKGHTQGADSASYIKLVGYHPEKMEYEAKTNAPRLAVFSEIWYPEWKVYIDGTPAELAKVDYTLRGVVIPAGSHKVEMVFESDFWKRESISRISSIALLLVSLLLFFANQIPGLKKLTATV